LRFLLLNTASVSSAKKVNFFRQADVDASHKDSVIASKALMLGRQDALFLTQSDDLNLLSAPKIITAPRASGDWSSHLLVSMGDQINVEKLTRENPFTVVAFFKIKDYALREVASRVKDDGIQDVLLNRFRLAIEQGKKDCFEPNPTEKKRKIEYGVFFSYGSNDDIVVVCGSNSLCLASYAICHMRGVTRGDLGLKPAESQFEHFMWDSNCLVAVNLTPDDATFKNKMETLSGDIVDKAHTYASISLSSRPGHSPLAIQQFVEKSEKCLVDNGDFCSAFKGYGVHHRRLLPIDKALVSLARLIEMGENETDRCRHIRQTCMEVCVDRPNRGYTDTVHVSRTRAPVKYNNYLSHLCEKLYVERNTIDTLESSFSRVFAVASEDASRFAYAYPEASCYSALIDLNRAFNRQSKAGKFLVVDANEQILQWVDLMDSCYRDRYRGFGAIGAIANLPILSHQGAFGRTLVVCDFLVNSFLWLQQEVLRKQINLNFNHHIPVIVSRFSPAETPSIHVTNMGTVFLDIGWRTVFAPDAVYYLCHESANVLMTGYFGAQGQEKTPIVFDVLADWVALNTIAVPTDETLHRYFRSLSRLGVIPGGEYPCSSERIELLCRIALRFHILSDLIVARQEDHPLEFKKILMSRNEAMMPEDLIDGFLCSVGLPSLCSKNVQTLKYTKPRLVDVENLFHEVYPRYSKYPHEKGEKQAEEEFWCKLEGVVNGATNIRATRTEWESDRQSPNKVRAAKSLALVCEHVEAEAALVDDEYKKTMLVLVGLRAQIVDPDGFFAWMGKYKEDVNKLSSQSFSS